MRYPGQLVGDVPPYSSMTWIKRRLGPSCFPPGSLTVSWKMSRAFSQSPEGEEKVCHVSVCDVRVCHAQRRLRGCVCIGLFPNHLWGRRGCVRRHICNEYEEKRGSTKVWKSMYMACSRRLRHWYWVSKKGKKKIAWLPKNLPEI